MFSVSPDKNPHLKTVVDKLVDVYKKNTFASEFKVICQGLTTAESFFVKQELARLFKPALRTIDMGRFSQYEVFEFDFSGRHFYLDEIGKRIFLQQAKRYQNQYTQGVYEAVNDANRYAIFEKQYLYEQNVKNFQVTLTELGRTSKRLEERLFCAKPVKIIRQDGSELKAITSNISRNGCLLRVYPFSAVKKGEVFVINFHSLTELFTLPTDPRPAYQVKFVASMPDADGAQKVGVQLFEHDYDWSQFLDKYVLDNKSTFKVDISNAREMAECRLLEEHLLHLSRWIMVFAQGDNSQFKTAKYTLSNPNSAAEHAFFSLSDNSTALDSVVKKLSTQLTQTSQIACIVRFSHQGRSEFLAAPLKQLLADNLFKPLLIFAAQHGELKYFRVRKTELNASAIEGIKFNWFKSQSEADDAWAPITDLKLLYSLYSTEVNLPKELTSDLNQLTLSAQDKAQLALLRCKHIDRHKLAKFDIEASCQRAEMRYFWASPAIVYINENEEIKCYTRDISYAGLSIKLSCIPQEIRLNQTLAVHIPAVFNLGKKAELEWVFYRIVGINEDTNTVHLCLLETEKNTTAKTFIRRLIDANQDQFAVNSDPDKFDILHKALKILFVTQYPSIAFSLGRSKRKFITVGRMLTADKDVTEIAVLRLLGGITTEQQMSVYPFIYDAKQTPNYLSSVVEFGQKKKAIADELFFTTHPDPSKCIRVNAFNQDPAFLSAFINKALQKKTLQAVSLHFSPVGFNHTECIQETINYIRKSNRHQANSIQNIASDLTGLAEVAVSTDLWELWPTIIGQLKV